MVLVTALSVHSEAVLVVHADSEALERVGREDGGDPHERGQDEAQQEHHHAHPHHHLSSVMRINDLGDLAITFIITCNVNAMF